MQSIDAAIQGITTTADVIRAIDTHLLVLGSAEQTPEVLSAGELLRMARLRTTLDAVAVLRAAVESAGQ